VAVLARGKFHHNSGWAPALVRAQYDVAGDVVADATATSTVVTVDVILLGFSNGLRESVTVGVAVNNFEFTDEVSA
jgi:hypothetical protein